MKNEISLPNQLSLMLSPLKVFLTYRANQNLHYHLSHAGTCYQDWCGATWQKKRMVSFPFTFCIIILKKKKKKWLEFIHRTLVIKDVFSIGKHAGEYATEEKPA